MVLRAGFDAEAATELTASWELRIDAFVLHAAVADGNLEAGVGPLPDKPDPALTFKLDGELPSFRALMRAAKCGPVELEGQRSLLNTFLRVFVVPQPALSEPTAVTSAERGWGRREIQVLPDPALR